MHVPTTHFTVFLPTKQIIVKICNLWPLITKLRSQSICTELAALILAGLKYNTRFNGDNGGGYETSIFGRAERDTYCIIYIQFILDGKH